MHGGYCEVNQSTHHDRTVGQASPRLISARGHYRTADTGSVITVAPAASHRTLSKCQKANWACGRATQLCKVPGGLFSFFKTISEFYSYIYIDIDVDMDIFFRLKSCNMQLFMHGRIVSRLASSHRCWTTLVYLYVAITTASFHEVKHSLCIHLTIADGQDFSLPC